MKHRQQHDSFGLWLLVFLGLALVAMTLAASIGAFSIQVLGIF